MDTATTETEVPVEQSVDDKLAAKFGLDEQEPQAQAPEPEAVEATPETDELLPEEIQAEEAPSDDEVEITHNGQKKRLKKQEALELAQKGFDYTVKTQQVAEQARLIEQQKRAVKARESAFEQTLEAAASVKAIQAQMEPYQKVDWVALAQSDPNAYPQHHANYQRLQMSLQQAQAQLQQVGQQAQSVVQASEQIDRQMALNQLYDLVPQWKDSERFAKDRTRVLENLKAYQYSEGRLTQYLDDPSFVAMARDAALYREALRSRADGKNKVPVAPAVKPGAAPARATPKQQTQEVIRQLHQAKDPARKEALLDEALARKFNLR